MEEIYEIYTKCIGKNILDKETFKKMFKEKNNRLFLYENKAFLILRENIILLLCVDPKYQNMGIGSKLLIEAEKYIKEKGYTRSNLGMINNTSFLKGVPFENSEYMFFDNHGYEDTNILEDKLFDANNDFKFSYNVIVENLKEIDKLPFLNFFHKYDKQLVKDLDGNKKIIVTKKDNKFIGFCQIDFKTYKDFDSSIGLITNLFILPEYRKTIEANALLKYCCLEFIKNNINKFEILKYNDTLLSDEIKGKTYVKYYVGTKEL